MGLQAESAAREPNQAGPGIGAAPGPAVAAPDVAEASAPPRRRAAAAASLALALLAVALAAGSGGWAVLAGAFGFGALLAGAVAGIGPLRARFVRPRGARAFETLFARDAAPAALTDSRGRVLAANAAFAGGRATRTGGMIETRLAPADADVTAAAEVYRLLRAARLEGRASARSLGLAGEARRVSVERLEADRMLWRLEPARPLGGAAALAALDALGLPAAAWEAGALRPNHAARRLRPDMARLLEQAGAAPPPGLATAEGAPLSALPAPGAAQAWLLTPRPSEGEGAAEVVEHLPVAVARLRLDGTLVQANEPARRLLGPGAVPGAALADLAEGLGRSIRARLAEAARGQASGRSEIARGRREDRETFLQLSLTRVDFDGKAGLVAVMSDATELKMLEAQFVQSQKMEAVGQLAGGVAHDFNNLLTAIAGHTDLLLMRRDESDADHPDLMQIRQNANRAAALVRQLLAFSRKQTLRPEEIDLAEALGELSHLLDRLIGEKVSLRLEHGEALGRVRADPRQFEQVVMNLVVNARDAMPEGGEVVIRTRNACFEQEFRRDRAVVPPGSYVAVEVADTGVGIPPDRIGQIFDPFYTSKKPGEGTGLGLSTAYGIVKQTGGFIFADSVPGEGTRFTVLLPRQEAAAAAPVRPSVAVPPVPEAGAPGPAAGRGEGAPDGEAPGPSAGPGDARAPGAVDAPSGGEGAAGPARGVGGVVLLVEDEAPVRSFAARALGLRGYRVLEADSAEVALELLEDAELEVDAIVSDVVMPGLDGPSWVKTARQARPGVAVVFVSGYAEGAFRKSLEGLERFEFLPKPYALKDLARAIETARAASSPDGAGRAAAGASA